MSDRSIIESVRAMAKKQFDDPVSIVLVSVTAVNINARTCDGVAIGSDGVTDILGIALMAGVSDGLLMVPNIGSVIMAAYSTRNAPVAVLYSDISQLTIYAGVQVSIAAPAVQLNDGSLGGLVEVIPLVKKINALERLVNQLIAQVTPLLAVGIPPAVPIPLPTLRADLENTTITHGI